MTIAMQPIYTQIVGSGGSGGIGFNNIPQTFTDLYLVVSARFAASGAGLMALYFNNETYPASTTFTSLIGNGSTVTSTRTGTYGTAGNPDDASLTANTFNSSSLYIPNYTSSNFKQLIVDSVKESNTATITDALSLNSVLWRSTAPITRLFIDNYPTTFVQYSTFSLYGITKG